ncbi:MAG: NAD-dependent epimerase/dehydratase family protein [Pirellulales bacterium]|nr:NAD-dependent epimerase/dehydratase family protein [Pirellulales bacterium]
MNSFPDTIDDIGQLEELLSEPTEAAIQALEQIPGDILILGVAGKMGPTLARMARQASDRIGLQRRIIGVSRFSARHVQEALHAHGIETIRGDLLDEPFLKSLPEAPNIIFMAGMKFGATENASQTWAMNVLLPALVCQRFPKSRLVAFSTGNVYPLVPAEKDGSKESDPTGPIGEYAMTALGRERIFEYFCKTRQIPTALIRLNYAVEMRYGVLVDVAKKVWAGLPIDVTMGCANVIWQGDANAMALATLADAAIPPWVINVAGPERIRIREVAEQFAGWMKRPVQFSGIEADTALLSDGRMGHLRYGRPRVGLDSIIRWTAHWVMRGGASHDKPTHYEVRNGNF